MVNIIGNIIFTPSQSINPIVVVTNTVLWDNSDILLWDNSDTIIWDS